MSTLNEQVQELRKRVEHLEERMDKFDVGEDCSNCKHTNQRLDEPPCDVCRGTSSWEPQE